MEKAKGRGLCPACYGIRYPKGERLLPPLRWFHGGKWIDISSLMSWRNEHETITSDEQGAVKESRHLLSEEQDN
jgi:hypothetical protein